LPSRADLMTRATDPFFSHLLTGGAADWQAFVPGDNRANSYRCPNTLP
jgi:hypothetical protein